MRKIEMMSSLMVISSNNHNFLFGQYKLGMKTYFKLNYIIEMMEKIQKNEKNLKNKF